jgi:hypothetical protein
MTQQLFNLNSTDYQLLGAAIAEVRQQGILLIYRDIYRYMRQRTADRYRRAAKDTPYARASIGTRQAVSGRIRGRGALFGIDSGKLFGQLTNNVKIDNRGIYIYSDLAYAGKIMELFARKGPFAPDSPLFVDDDDLIFVGNVIADRVNQAIAAKLAQSGRG